MQGEGSVDWHRKCRSSNLALNKSRTGSHRVNNEDIIRIALELYLAQEKKQFKFVDAWIELRKCDKFNSRTTESPSSVGESSSENGPSPKSETSRPVGGGVKASKKRRLYQDTLADDKVERLTIASEERNRLLARQIVAHEWQNSIFY